MTRLPKRLLLLLLPPLLLFSCKAKRGVVSSGKLTALTATELLERSNRHRAFGELSGKVSITYTNEKERRSFNARVRMKQDSVIWVSIAPLLGIEVVRAMITPDSLMLLDRINGRYYLGPFSRLNDLLQVDMDFSMLQSLVTGNSLELHSQDVYRSREDSGQYVVETVSPTRRELQKGALPVSMEQQTRIESQQFNVTHTKVYDTVGGHRLEADYADIRPLGAVHFPARMTFIVSGNREMRADMVWSRLESTSGQQFPFSVPESYEQIR